ncbi:MULTISPECIES: S10 family peptidase [unclassified Sphingomonas]|uniref:S10 family peptidase n=1 Tax=unclassified Sphingomonas TaxID=196159 RepID=UPI000701D434|nr:MULTISPECIES: peptidase S10 [unclassified Sphingomonas]KQX25040.1 peptidase S10 [Sphingomonas sp. Root1294]KQY66057.1 peptidase S10 [Sphingomonas sp. Root50]KRB89779.1 peptidase S10 [Sphingomonas sp. Root720]
MMIRTAFVPFVLASVTGLAIALAAPAIAQQDGAQPVRDQVDHPAVVTKHKGRFGGQSIAYTATVEGISVMTGANEGAKIVSFAYTRDKVDPAKRPVMFLFNGGPIVAAQYLHIGGIGPKRVAYPDDVKADPSTFALVDNIYSPLDAVDMVFVDPASTGFSRVAPGTDPKAYFSVKADAAQFAAYIRAWLKQHGREGSPVYLTGESYGTNRAAEIAGQLADGPVPLPLAGIFLYGQAANIIEYSQRAANVTSYVASLPTIAAIGFYHGKADRKGRSLETFLAEARSFAKGDYLTVLYQGNAASDGDRRRIADRLAEYSGIAADWYLANDLKITKERYRVELLKDQGLLLGRSDARYTAPITDKGSGADPADVLMQGVQTFMPIYLRQDLKVDWKDPYVPAVAIASLEDWGWGDGTSPFADWPYYKGITRMMTLNPGFRLLIGNGTYDTQTTMGAAELLATQSGWDPARVTLRYYDGGHTGYSVAATAKAIGDDIRALVR